ncbi:MAG: peptidylprolyl isomerase [Patescibacteria group bacterium]
MGKRARIRKQKIEQEKIERKEMLEKIYYEKNPWLKFWKRIDFWIYTVCLLAVIAYPFAMKGKINMNDRAIIHTSMGDIEIELYGKDAPKTVDNFEKLAKEGFYDGLLWHRVVEGFVIQTGDPNGDGTGGPGYQFDDEINSQKFVTGSVGMANAGENTNGSQFFITTSAEAEQSLDGKYTNFGLVVRGLDVVQAIGVAPVDENDKPLSDITVESIEIK